MYQDDPKMKNRLRQEREYIKTPEGIKDAEIQEALNRKYAMGKDEFTKNVWKPGAHARGRYSDLRKQKHLKNL